MLKKYKFDILLILGLLIIGITLLIIWLNNVKGVVGSYASVIKVDKEILKIDLKYDDKYEIEGEQSKVIITVSSGKISVTESGCRDQICVHHYEISKVGEEIICLPNKIIIRIGE